MTTQEHGDTNKVIDIFKRHRKGDHLHFPVEEGGELIVSPDGFNYVSFKEAIPSASSDAHPQPEPACLEVAHKKHYIFKFLEQHREYQRIDNYYVPGERLLEFLESLSKRPGRLMEIQQFIPDFVG